MLAIDYFLNPNQLQQTTLRTNCSLLAEMETKIKLIPFFVSKSKTPGPIVATCICTVCTLQKNLNMLKTFPRFFWKYNV